MFYALKVSTYMGWHYYVFSSEEEAKKQFNSYDMCREFMGFKAIQLFRMNIMVPSTGFAPIYPVFIPTHKWDLNKKTFQYEWRKVKRKYILKGE